MRAFIVLALFAGALAGQIKVKPVIKPAEKVGLKLNQKSVAAKAFSETTTTLAQTQKMLAQVFMPTLDQHARNQAGRQYFKNVYHLPTTHQKMGATEAFLQSAHAFQVSIGRDPGTVERLTPNELEHWLTTEYLPESFKDAGTGLGYLYPKVKVPPGLVSRGPDFARHFVNSTSCISGFAKESLAEKKMSLNYGTSCGQTNALGSAQGCDGAHKKIMRIQNDDREVCNDGGTDACCAQHDLVRTGININPLASFTGCKANTALKKCLSGFETNKVFEDKRGVSEVLANQASQCIYNVMPCLAATKNKFYEINFKTKNVPHVRSMYPQKGDHHVQVVFPFDHSYGEDMTDETTVYRKSMQADVEYSHWKHIDPPADQFGANPSTYVDQHWNNANWDSIV